MEKIYIIGFVILHSYPDIITIAKSVCARACLCVRERQASYMKDVKSAYKIFVGKPEGKRLFQRPSRIREENTKLYLDEIVWLWTVH
jgi:hypothetical protein